MQVTSLLAAALLVAPGVIAAPASPDTVAPADKRGASDNVVENKTSDELEANADWDKSPRRIRRITRRLAEMKSRK
ncbi:hypothetical protein F5B19DRAFT_488379 [Rostrohypoxylon terebratum]|nr:hypothetical protein F5B19DRAFT_488379 [Rostrohypoxylon terebratum]